MKRSIVFTALFVLLTAVASYAIDFPTHNAVSDPTAEKIFKYVLSINGVEHDVLPTAIDGGKVYINYPIDGLQKSGANSMKAKACNSWGQCSDWSNSYPFDVITPAIPTGVKSLEQ